MNVAKIVDFVRKISHNKNLKIHGIQPNYDFHDIFCDFQFRAKPKSY